MPSADTSRSEESPSVEEKIGGLEKTLALDARLQALEAAIRERLPIARPWWKDAKVVAFLGALIAAILPVATWISNVYANSREANRLLAEQQERIRQTYIEKVFRPGITQTDQEQLFGLLARLSSDPELQGWAKDQLQRTKDTINELKKAKEQAEKNLAESQAAVASLNAKVSQLTESERKAKATATATVANLNRQIEQLNHQIGDLPAKVPSLSCDVQFVSDPPGASVTIYYPNRAEYEALGSTPTHGILARSRYYVTFEKAGFRSVEVATDLDDDECKVFGRLRKLGP